jgi:hypothetical protein
MATWNTCLWGGRCNCVIPAHDTELSERLVSCFAVDVLLPVQPDEAAKAFIDRFPHLKLHRWGDSIFREYDCEFADIRHALRRVAAHQVKSWRSAFAYPSGRQAIRLALSSRPNSAAILQRMPTLQITRVALRAHSAPRISQFSVEDELPITLLEGISP